MKYLILLGLVYVGYRLFFNPGRIESSNNPDDHIEYTDYEEVEGD